MATPSPPVPPAVPSNPGFYSASSVSGMLPASGESGAFSGPWMIEEQTLNIHYARTPHMILQSYGTSLSSYTATHIVDFTHMIFAAAASYIRRKDYLTYSTSSWTQLQRFEVQAVSADPSGVSYGTVSAGTFGLGGIVYTSQPWYFRRYWNTSDEEVDETALGWSYFITDALCPHTHEGHVCANGEAQNDYLWDYVKSYISWMDGSPQMGARANFSNANGETTFTAGDSYVNPYGWEWNAKAGGYSTDQDLVTDVHTLVNSVGDTLGNPGAGSIALVVDSLVGPVTSDSFAKLSNYSSGRHAWTQT